MNFVTCHDGFTLNDLVSYDGKHNEANGEDNRDGTDDNGTWNCGVEDPNDPEVEALRNRQIEELPDGHRRLSLGMSDASDGRRSAAHAGGGNKNAYCHDDPRRGFD